MTASGSFSDERPMSLASPAIPQKADIVAAVQISRKLHHCFDAEKSRAFERARRTRSGRPRRQRTPIAKAVRYFDLNSTALKRFDQKLAIAITGKHHDWPKSFSKKTFSKHKSRA
jgi:hypothetical protein